MTESVASPLRRFRTAARYYLAGRPPYAPRLIADVALLCGLSKAERVLDLGCGPGPLAVALAPLAGEVVALDPEPAMLQAAVEHASRAGVAVRFIEGGSEDLGPHLGTFSMVTIGRAFHWMDRARTLERLDARVAARGAVVLFADRHPEVPDNAWLKPYRELLEQYAADDAGRAERKAPGWLTHEAVLLGSAFDRLERVAVIERRRTAIDVFAARAFSMSSTAPDRLGARAHELERRVRELMASHASGAVEVTEVLETEALIARRRRDFAD